MRVRTEPGLALEASGPGAFSVLMKDRTQREAQRLGGLATLGMVMLLLVAYRSVPVLVLGLLPLVTAGLAGLAAVSAVFGTVHGITLAFGFTLIGVAQDYPMHLFSHQHRGLDPRDNARALWPTLATGVASTCVAYLAFLFSGVRGLAQLSVFTVTGLAVAGLTTRFLLPRLVPARGPDAAASGRLGRLWDRIAGLPRPTWLGVLVALLCIGVLALSPRPLWQDELGGLTPVPRALIERDSALRRELGAPDVRYLLVIQDRDAQGVLARAAALDPQLEALVATEPWRASTTRRATCRPSSNNSGGVPRCRRRPRCRQRWTRRCGTTPFRPGVFAPFLADVERARQLPPLEPGGPRRHAARGARRRPAARARRSLDRARHADRPARRRGARAHRRRATRA